jgi:hypothetical protein
LLPWRALGVATVAEILQHFARHRHAYWISGPS